MMKDPKTRKDTHQNDRHILNDIPVLTGEQIYITKDWIFFRFYSPHKTDRRLFTAILLLMATFGLMLLFPVFTHLHDILDSKSWPSVNGTVLLSGRLISRPEHSANGAEAVQIHYIRFQYEANGKVMTGNRVTLYDEDDQYFVKWVVKHFPKGTKCKVYCNPIEPLECIVMPGLPWTLERRTWFGGFLLAAGVLGLILRPIIFYKAGWKS